MPRLMDLYDDQRKYQPIEQQTTTNPNVTLLCDGWWKNNSKHLQMRLTDTPVRPYTKAKRIAEPIGFGPANTDPHLPKVALRTDSSEKSQAEFVYAVVDADNETWYCRIGQFQRFPYGALRNLFLEHVGAFLRDLQALWQKDSAFAYKLAQMVAVATLEGPSALDHYVAPTNWLFYGSAGTGKTTMAGVWSRFLYLVGVVRTGYVAKWSPLTDAPTESDLSRSIDYFLQAESFGGILLVRNAESLSLSASGRYLANQIVMRDHWAPFPTVVLCATTNQLAAMDRRLVQECETVQFGVFGPQITVQVIRAFVRSENARIAAGDGPQIAYDWLLVDRAWIEHHLLPFLAKKRRSPLNNAHAVRRLVVAVNGCAATRRWLEDMQSSDYRSGGDYEKIVVHFSDFCRALQWTAAESKQMLQAWTFKAE